MISNSKHIIAPTAAEDSPNVREALQDIAWLPIVFSSAVGAPSVLAIIQAIFEQYRLSPAIQWIVDGYAQISKIISYIFEPILEPALDWINSTFNWSLTLNAVWHPVFLLLLICVASGARAVWYLGLRSKAVRLAIRASVLALLSSIFIGLTTSQTPSIVPVPIFMFGCVVCAGLLFIWGGLREGDIYRLKVGFGIVGGIVTAAMIAAADALLKLL